MTLTDRESTPAALRDTRAGAVMSTGVFSAPRDSSAARLAALMSVRGVHAVVVADPRREAQAVSSLDVLRAVHETGDPGVPVSAAAALPRVGSEASLASVAATMADRDAAHVLVAPGDEPLPAGIVSSLDVAAALAGHDTRLLRIARPGPARPSPSSADLDRVAVRQVMHDGVVTCRGLAPLSEVAATLADRHLHCVVVAGVPAAEPGWAVLSDMDLVRAVAAGETDAPAGALAATEPLVVDEGEPLSRAAALMAEHEVEHLVTARAGVPTGVVSSLDVLAVVATAA